MADRLEELLLNPGIWNRLSERGLETAERYALTRVAPFFSDALKHAFDGGSRR